MADKKQQIVNALLAVILPWSWQPIAPPMAILAAAVVLIFLAGLGYRRAGGLSLPQLKTAVFLIRLIIITAITIILLGPSRSGQPVTDKRRAQLTILLDVSPSMLTKDVNGASRLQAAMGHWLRPDQLRQLDQRFDVQVNTFSDALYPLASDRLMRTGTKMVQGSSTHLILSLQKTMSAHRDATVLILSDGRDTTDDLPVFPDKRSGVTVHTVCFGRPGVQRDLALTARALGLYQFVKETGQIVVELSRHGLPVQALTVYARCGERQTEHTAVFDSSQTASITLPVRHLLPGLYAYELWIEPDDRETGIDNNRTTVFIRVIDKRIGVLLLEGEPSWDTQFIARALRRDDRINLVQITQLGSANRQRIITRQYKAELDQATIADLLIDMDVVILGHHVERIIDATTALALQQFVMNGPGHMVLARGLPYDRQSPRGAAIERNLSVLEPVIWNQRIADGVIPTLTTAGRQNLWLQSLDMAEVQTLLPPLEGLWTITAPKLASRVLLRTSEQSDPLLITMNVGQGRVAAVLGQGLWRWRMAPVASSKLATFYDAFWVNMVRWLVAGDAFTPGAPLHLQTDAANYALHDTVVFEVAYREVNPDNRQPILQVTDPSSGVVHLTLTDISADGRHFRTTYQPTSSGIYTVRLHESPGTEAKFIVHDRSRERLRLSSNAQLLRRIAETTGGRMWRVDHWQTWFEHVERHSIAASSPGRRRWIWDRWPVLVALVLLLGGEWFVRRKAGLL